MFFLKHYSSMLQTFNNMVKGLESRERRGIRGFYSATTPIDMGIACSDDLKGYSDTQKWKASQTIRLEVGPYEGSFFSSNCSPPHRSAVLGCTRRCICSLSRTQCSRYPQIEYVGCHLDPSRGDYDRYPRTKNNTLELQKWDVINFI